MSGNAGIPHLNARFTTDNLRVCNLMIFTLLLLSGANINFDRLRFVAERAEVGEAREALLAVTIPERPGAFREFCAAIGRRVVTEFNYRLSGRGQAHIFVGVATQSRQDAAALAAMLEASGYETADLTDN